MHELGDPATMAVNKMGDPIDMEDEDEYDGDEGPIDGDALNALMDALKENRWSEVVYVEAYLGKSDQRVRIMVDSGNLVSKEFADWTGLPYRPDSQPIATASTEGQLMTVGECDPLQLRIQGLDSVFTVRPWWWTGSPVM